jgi:hypothetical protein
VLVKWISQGPVVFMEKTRSQVGRIRNQEPLSVPTM